MLLQQHYISCLLLAGQNNELLIKNHQSRLTGSKLFPEVNVSALFPEVNASTSFSEVNASNFWRAHDRGRDNLTLKIRMAIINVKTKEAHHTTRS